MSLELEACPYFGLDQDPATRLTFPSAAHRCRAARRPRTIGLAHQAAFCLTKTYPTCDRYRPPRDVDAGYPIPMPAKDGPPRLADGQIDRASQAGQFARRVIEVMLIVLILAAIWYGGLRIAALVLPANVAQASPSTLPAVGSPTATPTPTPVPSPTASPTPVPVVYTVKKGDTLKSIAAEYGTTVQAIKNANKLKSSTIRVGQKLIIPPPR
jgi:LysM domain-containing protein